MFVSQGSKTVCRFKVIFLAVITIFYGYYTHAGCRLFYMPTAPVPCAQEKRRNCAKNRRQKCTDNFLRNFNNILAMRNYPHLQIKRLEQKKLKMTKKKNKADLCPRKNDTWRHHHAGNSTNQQVILCK